MKGKWSSTKKKALFELPVKFALSPIDFGSMFWSVLAQLFPFPTIPDSSLGWKGWHLCAWCMPRWHQLVLPSAMLWAAWDSWGCPCSLQGGWSWMATTGPFWPKLFCCSVEHTFTAVPALIWHCPCGWFPFCTDSCFYTKIIKWVFLARQILLFCSWVTFVWSLLIPLPRSSDILSKKAWKHLTDMTFQGVFIYSACWHLLIPRNYFCMSKHKAATLCPCNYCDCLPKSRGFVCKWPEQRLLQWLEFQFAVKNRICKHKQKCVCALISDQSPHSLSNSFFGLCQLKTLGWATCNPCKWMVALVKAVIIVSTIILPDTLGSWFPIISN